MHHTNTLLPDWLSLSWVPQRISVEQSHPGDVEHAVEGDLSIHRLWALHMNIMNWMQCTGNSGCFPRGNWAAIVWWPYFFFCVQCFDTTGCDAYSFTTDGYGIFNMRKNVGACQTHEGGSGTNKSAQELTQFSCPSPCPIRGSNSVFGFEFQLSNHWATPPPPPPSYAYQQK